MVKQYYSREPPIAKNAVKSKAVDVRTHFKNTFNVARVIRGMYLSKCQRYLKDVLAHKRCIPFVRYNSIARTPQAKEFGLTLGRWPEKSVKVIIGLLKNLEANANVKGLEVEKLVLSHVQVNQAPKGRRRTYRAHGRINPYMNCPCHIELWASIKEENVKKEAPKKTQALQLSKKAIARQRKLKVGE